MSLKTIAEQRQKFRAECRKVADDLMGHILEKLDKVPEDQQVPVISMVVTEMNILTKKVQKDG